MSFDNRSSTVDGNNGSNPEVQSQAPSLCKTGCGFYGNPVQEGLCSKCYKDKMKCMQQNLPSNSGSATCAPNAQEEARSLFTPSSLSALSPASSNHENSSEASGGAELPHEDASEVHQKAPETVVEQDSSGPATTATSNVEINAADTASSSPVTEPEASAGKPRKNRCLACNKKVGLTGFSCRCGGLFCSTHRYSDKHNCDFDYKEHAQDQIRKNNPVVIGKKITKI